MKSSPYFSRDQLLVDVDKITTELKKSIAPPLRNLNYPLGTVDDFIDNVNILCDAKFA